MNATRTSRRTVVKAAALGAAVVTTGAPGAAPGFAEPATAPAGPILKPLPEKYFYSYGTNAETRWDAVSWARYGTEQSRLFVRNHTSTPVIDPKTYSLAIHGSGLRDPRGADQPVRLTLAQLKRIGRTYRTAVHECTGNGRSYFASQQGQTVSGTAWKLGAVGAVTWEGVRLADVLRHVGISPDAVDVLPTGLDAPYVDKGVDYGPVRRPLPIAKALDDALLVWGANGEPLLPDHGFPLRLVVPGWIGIASIKWLGSLEVSDTALTSPWNTKWYRMTGGDYPTDSPPLTVLPVKSAWELPEVATLPRGGGKLLHGRAWSGAGRIARVEVSTDGGTRWKRATLLEHGQAWSRFWFRWPGASPGEHTLMARATDVAGRTQPLVTPLNSNGYFFDAVVRHRVLVK
ncbi:DMSO/TMAO reductase YedYZ molybdopterin-dependent catalytic subunit [Marmoricola sp. OAE513]|uniref:sulfite oxidase n=1 Tax=Marmoricola sp. OAE513 TaxID=2817894 RepID=UPI001AE7B407